MKKQSHSLTIITFIFLFTITACSKEDAVSPFLPVSPIVSVPPDPNPPPTPPTLPPTPPNNNSAPIARAGNDTVIYVPFNSHFLNGKASSDPDGNIDTYNWRLIKGPDGPYIFSPNKFKSYVGGLYNVGEYEFELTVTDSYNLSSKDTVKVTIAEPKCSTSNKERIFTNLVWGYPWLMETGIDNLFSYLPANSYIRNFYIKRDGSEEWEKVFPLGLYSNAQGLYYEWEYFQDRLIIYPNTNTTEDTPDVKIEYCN